MHKFLPFLIHQGEKMTNSKSKNNTKLNGSVNTLVSALSDVITDALEQGKEQGRDATINPLIDLFNETKTELIVKFQNGIDTLRDDMVRQNQTLRDDLTEQIKTTNSNMNARFSEQEKRFSQLANELRQQK